ncbi:MAG TPA: TlpA disulfide reductase family protein [Candidatus Cybelea sp.]|jgi:thiol-disulfide isomerase/thioredoxin
MSTRAERRRVVRRASRESVTSPKVRAVAAFVTVALAICIAAITFVARRSVPPSATEAPAYASLTKGGVAPPFAVTTLTGSHLDSRRIAEPIMLEIFATWCPHCQRETQTIRRLRRAFGDRLSIVAVTGSDIASDHQSVETSEDVRLFARYFAVNYPMAYDPGLTVAQQYLQGSFPTIVFVNRAKRISSVEIGEIDLKRLSADARAAGVTGG